MFYSYKNNYSRLAKCQTFLFLILWVSLKDHNPAFAQEVHPNKLHFPQLRKPTPINHFHPKHKPVYQEIVRPSPQEGSRLTQHEDSILHGRLEYPKTFQPPAYDVILRRVNFDNEKNQDVTTIPGIVEKTMDYHNQEGVIQTVQSPSYTYVPSTENNWKGREESTTTYLVNEPITNIKEKLEDRIQSLLSNYNSNSQNEKLDDDIGHFKLSKTISKNQYTGLHQKIPTYDTDTLHGHFRPKHPKRYHEIRRGSQQVDDSIADKSSLVLATTMMPITNRPDTTFYSTEGVRNTTIISIQDLKNRFTNNKLMTTTAPWQDENDETENYLKYKNIQHQQHVVETDENYDTTRKYGIQEITTNRSNKSGKQSYANNRLVETQVRNPYKNNQGELIRSQPSQRAYGGSRQRPTYESVSPTITPPHYYDIDYDDRMSPQPRQYKYKWNQPSTEAIRSMNSYNNLYQQPASPPPRRHYQIQRTRQSRPGNAPIPYPPIPTYPSSTVKTTNHQPITADRRNEYVNIDRSTMKPYVTTTYDMFSPEPTTALKKASSKGKLLIIYFINLFLVQFYLK